SAEDHYFGRNLDLEYSYNETVVITPQNYSFKFREVDNIDSHHAIIGMAFVVDNYPLYYEACNEKGLSMAGLNYYEASYHDYDESKDNITPFEFIPWILCQCENVKEALELIKNINLVNINFSEELPLSPLHWMISDKENSLVVECEADGLKAYYNPIGVMTNSPSFDKQSFNLNDYRHLSAQTPMNTFSDKLKLDVYSRGMGAIGLPGDLSSSSRFVKAAFTLHNILLGDSEEENVNQFFHVLGSVTQQRGCCQVAEDKYEYTIYSSCINTDKGIYYYKTYYNTQITAVNMYDHDLTEDELTIYPLVDTPQINFQSSKKEEYMFN
ncbi:MAG: choloylglycine hydrolase, partial [Methanosphaera sp. rholeuAM270]